MLESQRDELGTRREYETIFILRPDTDSEQIHDVNVRLRKLVEETDGRLLRIENWGKRKLAYEIKKHPKGIYLYWRYLAVPRLIHELERNLRMLDVVLRHMTVKLDENIDPHARPSDFSEEDFMSASETAPDEEDFYLGRSQSGDAEGAADGDVKTAETKDEGAKGEEAKGEEAKGEEAKGEEAKGEEAKGEEAKGEEAKGEAAQAAGDETAKQETAPTASAAPAEAAAPATDGEDKAATTDKPGDATATGEDKKED